MSIVKSGLLCRPEITLKAGLYIFKDRNHFLWLSFLLFCFLSCKDDDANTFPEVSSISPSTALPGDIISISGRLFSAVPGENVVSFNGKNAVVSDASAMELNVIVPDDVTTGPVSVNVNGRPAANQPVFTVGSLPAIITSITPMSGGYNTVVNISGSNFHSTAAGNTVTFNGVAAIIQSATSTSITAIVTVRSGSGPVAVNGVTSDIVFNYFPEVFVVGYEVNGTTTSAKVWKNGVQTVLSKPTEFATAIGIAVSTTDVYISGYALENGYSVARYWKNNVDTPLPGNELSSSANGVSIIGSDVYIIGSHAKMGATNIAGYWKNESLAEVDDDNFPSFAQTHTIVGTDVYLAGGEFVDGANVATYWKNGKSHRVSEVASLINGIVVQGEDIYMAGYEATAPTIKFATYWKNDVAVHLTSGLYQAEATAIKIVGNDVYVTGYEQSASHYFIAKYWKNGVEIKLANGATSSYATSIDVLGNDVYVGGAEHNGRNASVAKYWKNGVSMPMTDGFRNAFAYSVLLR